MAAYKLCYSMEDSRFARSSVSAVPVRFCCILCSRDKEDRSVSCPQEMVSVGRIPDKAYKGYNSMPVIDSKEMPW